MARSSLATTLKDSMSKAGAPHMMVDALAGTGKTTTNLGGIANLLGFTPEIEPSVQQKAIWEVMAYHKDEIKTIHCAAFNRAIADTLSARIANMGLPSIVTASTMHGMGNRIITRTFGKVKLIEYRVRNIVSELLDVDIYKMRREHMPLLQGVESLVGLCKANLIDPDHPDKLDDLAAYYDLELDPKVIGRIFEMVPKVIERCKDVPKDGGIDYADMVWLPIALNLPAPKYSLLLVDEAQDLNMVQQELTFRYGIRLGYTGDPHQAIYGWAGADCDAMPRMGRRLMETASKCEHLPLTVTYRCGKAIVKEAQKIVPKYEAHDSNCDGKIHHRNMEYKKAKTVEQDASNYRSHVMSGDMVMCRVNAPLVSECFRFIKAGRRANIQGRKIGAGLLSMVDKSRATSVPELVKWLSIWLQSETDKEQAKRNPSEARIMNLGDKYDCMMCFTEDVGSVPEVKDKINKIFTDNKDEESIILSSIHKAKGLEANRTFLIINKQAPLPHPMAKTAWAKEQERNLLYVAITRAKEELTYVS